jgi:hypothetical protein
MTTSWPHCGQRHHRRDGLQGSKSEIHLMPRKTNCYVGVGIRILMLKCGVQRCEKWRAAAKIERGQDEGDESFGGRSIATHVG